ncbi:amylopullulanase domain protein, putative [Heliomicrobium modesticaldum Ice1]|uniref:Amylopullulanase domain protein, putative n=1 Tax=Heliobacterium modesticaldum (strain ATCC 51547 / Ice1) TaxID=498761 RepID=B0THL5_HELMI|nr:S-layer homology domain-containing protein [Heliomicrobium modesticaldum]ABZ83453.1 amylopullulanase domain protein, putative [Heliomicrobium modesticaldum Ice1]
MVHRKSLSSLFITLFCFVLSALLPPSLPQEQDSAFTRVDMLTVAQAAYDAPSQPTLSIVGKNQVKVAWTYTGAAPANSKFKIIDLQYDSNGTELDTMTYYPTQKQYSKSIRLDDGLHKLAVVLVTPVGERFVSTYQTIDVQELAAPSNLTGAKQGSREILWSWTDNSYGETGFKIYDENDDLVGRVDANKTSFRESGLKPDTRYTRYVKAYKATSGIDPARESNASNEASERTDKWDSSTGNSGRSKDRSHIADALEGALKFTVSPSDIVLINPGDIEGIDRSVKTEKNRFVAFAGGAFKGYSGGSVRISTPDVELKIPTKYLDRPEDSGGSAVGLQEYVDNAASAPPGRVRVGSAYEFSLIKYSNYSNNGYSDDDFHDDPLYLSFFYDYWRVSNPASLKIYRLNGSTWTEVGSSVNTADRSVNGRIEEFGRYALFETPTGTSGIYPGTSQTYGPGSYGYPGFHPIQQTPAGYPPGFGPGYGPGYSMNSPGYDPSRYDATNSYGAYPGAYGTYHGSQGDGSTGANLFSSAAQAPFIDLVGHWARPQVETLAGRGLINGTAARIFEPDRPMTRAEFLTLLMRVVGKSTPMAGPVPFDDVRADAWFAGALRQAIQQGIITEGSIFLPNSPITRQDMAAWLGRALNGRMILSNGGRPEHFSDWYQTTENLRDSIARTVRAGLISGRPDGTFDPWGSTTRAEAATVITAFLNQVR